MTDDLIATIAFWAFLGGVFYHYVGYPVLIWTLARAFSTPPRIPDPLPAHTPMVSVLVSALNEADVIGERIENALQVDYPADRFEFVVASDGSTDRTVDVVRRCEDARVRLLAFDSSRGKARVLNEVIPSLRGDVVILSDANTMIEPDVVRRMVRWLSRDEFAVVVGRLVLLDSESGTNVDGVYWKYETFLKKQEASLGALLGANGAIYGFRRNLFVPLPEDTLVDDFVLPLLIKLRTGLTLVYDMDSVAHEETPAALGSEVGRRSRIGAGGFISLKVLWPLLHPRYGFTALAFASHKLLRWFCPFLMLGALVANLFLLDHAVYRVTLAAQMLFFAAAAVGAVLPGSSKPVRLLRLATLFAAMQVALLMGFARWSRGSGSATWKRTERQART